MLIFYFDGNFANFFGLRGFHLLKVMLDCITYRPWKMKHKIISTIKKLEGQIGGNINVSTNLSIFFFLCRGTRQLLENGYYLTSFSQMEACILARSLLTYSFFFGISTVKHYSIFLYHNRWDLVVWCQYHKGLLLVFCMDNQ